LSIFSTLTGVAIPPHSALCNILDLTSFSLVCCSPAGFPYKVK
jgi:hypothetical protein